MRFREVLEKLDAKVIKEEFKPDIEMAKYISANQDQALLFENVGGWRVAANVCLREHMHTIFGDDLKQKMLNALKNPIDPVIVDEADFKEVEVDLTKMPILKHFNTDEGPYMTTAVYIAESEEHGRNLSYHRTLVYDKEKATARLTHRDLWKYYEEANRTLDVAICFGLDPAMLIAAGTSVDTNIDETSIAGGLLGEPVKLVKMENGVHVPADAEIVLLAKILPDEDEEGPFTDLTGTIDGIRKQPVVHVEKVLVKENPIYHALVSSKDEHGFLMGFPKEPVIWDAVSKVAKVKEVILPKGGASWLHCAVSIEEGDPKEVIDAALAAHKSVKHVFVYDEDIDILDPNEREWAMATRFQAHKDLYQFPGSKGSSLDPSSEPVEDRQQTTKCGFDCTIPKDKEKKLFLRGK